jgi:hypothetical protein
MPFYYTVRQVLYYLHHFFGVYLKKLNLNCQLMRIAKMYRLVFLLLAMPLFVQAQEKNVEYLEQTWFAYFNQTRFTEKSGVWVDLHLRLTGNFVNDVGLSIGRAGYTYFLTDNTRITAGYAYVTQYGLSEGDPDIPEHRPWQQLQWVEKKNWFTISQYIRLEERFRRVVEAGELTSDYSFNYRIRYNMALAIPLKGKELTANTPFLFVNDELHVNLGDEITNNYFDQNRFFIGLGYQFTAQLSAQLGYLKVFQQLSQPGTFRSIDAIRLFVFHNLDFRKKE